jgi:hypothetical protein
LHERLFTKARYARQCNDIANLHGWKIGEITGVHRGPLAAPQKGRRLGQQAKLLDRFIHLAQLGFADEYLDNPLQLLTAGQLLSESFGQTFKCFVVMCWPNAAGCKAAKLVSDFPIHFISGRTLVW